MIPRAGAVHADAGELNALEHLQARVFDATDFSRVTRLDVPSWTVALPILAIPLTMTLAVRRQAPHQKREAPPGSRAARPLVDLSRDGEEAVTDGSKTQSDQAPPNP